MNWLWRLLTEQPILLVLVIGWILSMVGGVLKQIGKQRQQPPASPPSAPRPQPRRPTAEEVAAEMRRILGGGQTTSPPRPARSPQQPSPPRRPQPVPPPPHRTQVIERAPLRSELPPPVPPAKAPPRLGDLQGSLAHFGEGIEKRQAPLSGAVGSAPLGALVRRGVQRAPSSRRAGLVDLHDLARVVVMNEVLGKPLALRDDW